MNHILQLLTKGKEVLLLPLLIVLSLSLNGCGGGGSTATPAADTVAPVMVAATYNITIPTHSNVIATVTTTELNIGATPAGWTRTGAAGAYSFTKTYTANATGVVTFSDSVGNTTNVTVTVANIDKVAPLLSSTTQAFTTTVGTALTLQAVTAMDAVDGALTVTQGGTVNFNVIGVYPVTYTATDAAGNSSTITHTYNVNAVANTAPTATNAVLDLGFAAEIGAYDLAPDIADAESADNLLTINVITPPAQGAIIWAGTQFRYQATGGSGYVGNDSFTYNVQDPQGLTSATMTVSINNILEDGLLNGNQAPIAANASIDLLSAAEAVTYDLAPYFADFESADNLLTINVITPPAQGSLFWTGTQFTYTATGGTGYAGNDSFTYNIQDPAAATSATRTVTINNILEDGIISIPTIVMADQNVNDNGGFASTALPAPTVTGVTAGAVYSIVADPTAGMLTINASTGVATWLGNLLGGGITNYIITIKVTNPDAGTQSVIFNLGVANNL